MSSNSIEDGLRLRDAQPVVEGVAAQARAQRHRRGVRFDPARRVIDVAGYALDLDRAANAAELLDWLVQIAGKSDDPQRLRDVIDELDDACRTVFDDGIQGVYCPWGEPRAVDWRRGVTRTAQLEEVL